MRDFDTNDFPQAYLITFRCYGTWLHGDQRGSMDRKQNVYGSPANRSQSVAVAVRLGSTQTPPLTLNSKHRQLIEEAIRDVCRHRKYSLHAIKRSD
jgi:hypothetical protein